MVLGRIKYNIIKWCMLSVVLCGSPAYSASLYKALLGGALSVTLCIFPEQRVYLPRVNSLIDTPSRLAGATAARPYSTSPWKALEGAVSARHTNITWSKESSFRRYNV